MENVTILNTDRFKIGIHDTKGPRFTHGWFEHNTHGDEFGGGLWFDGLTLVDYDGIAGYLPKEILDALESKGFDIQDMRPQD